MKSERLSWALGWASVGIGLTELTFPEHICRVLGARRRSGLMRVLGLREVANGLALLLQPHRPRWIWSHVVGDALDLALLAVTFRLPRGRGVWKGAITAAVAGAALVDIHAAVSARGSASVRAGDVTPSLGMELGGGAPVESWRGSGLAEDVGTSGPHGEEGEPDEVKRRMMRDAERKLGLPELDEHGSPR